MHYFHRSWPARTRAPPGQLKGVRVPLPFGCGTRKPTHFRWMFVSYSGIFSSSKTLLITPETHLSTFGLDLETCLSLWGRACVQRRRGYSMPSWIEVFCCFPSRTLWEVSGVRHGLALCGPDRSKRFHYVRARAVCRKRPSWTDALHMISCKTMDTS